MNDVNIARVILSHFDMTSPHITTVLRKRVKKPLKWRRYSIREVSRDYFGTESIWSVVELLIFGILVVIVMWPVINAAAAIRALLL